MHYNRTLSAASKFDRIDIVLVSPRNPLNIGAAARAMANFGFTHLSVVTPFEPHWREARSAVGALEVLRAAADATSLDQALAGSTLVFGTGTTERRSPEQPIVLLPEVAPLVEAELARGGRVALVFGPEKHGLTRDQLARCHRLLVIPTNHQQASMNLGQAVAVCLYELVARLHAGQELAPPSRDGTATQDQIERLTAVAGEVMDAVRYSPTSMRAANLHDTRLFLRRLGLSGNDARRILGFLRRVLWRLRH